MSKDLKKMIAEIRGALDQYPREQLQEILAWVFKEYVVEGGAAPAQSALAMLDARSELEGLSFAELVTWLQLHLDVPELAALEVQGARVSVRAGGRTVPIEVAAAPPQSSLVSHQSSASTAATTPAATTTPATTTPAIPPPQPMPPANPPASSHASPPPSPPNTPVAPPTTQPAADAKTDEKKDEAASRFSWLEVD